MKRKLFKQIRAEWRTNVWLALELLVVSVVLWYIIDYFYTTASIMVKPLGYDVEHCYKLMFNTVTDKSPSYIPDRTTEEDIADAREILSRMEHLPFVEAASISHNSHPYNGSSSGIKLRYDTIYNPHYLPNRMVTPGFLKVFRCVGLGGETPEQLAVIIERNELILGGNVFFDKRYLPENMIGCKFYCDDDTTMTITLGAAIMPMRDSEYVEWGNTAITGMTDIGYTYASEYCVRVFPDKDTNIEEQLMNMSESLFHVGNRLLVNVTSFKNIRQKYQQAQANKVRDMVFLMCFLLLNIFLGLFGTFWFRTQQRSQEIAIRIAMGASRGDIFRRLLSEGLILLLLITPVAVAFDCFMAFNELNTYSMDGYFITDRMIVTCGATFVLIALMIVGGIWIPADKARRVEPAITLKDE